MKSVLEALGSNNKLQRSSAPPVQSVTPPALSQSPKVVSAYVNVPIIQATAYEPIPRLDTDNSTNTSSESIPRNSHYDIPRISTTQQPQILPRGQSVVHELASPKPLPSPRQSPTQGRFQYNTPRPESSITEENNIYDVPRKSIYNEPTSPISNGHYDVPITTSQLPPSKSHYDVPRRPSSTDPLAQLPRTSSDTDLTTDTIKIPGTLPKAFTPPVTPRRFGNKAKTLDGTFNYQDMLQHNGDTKKNDTKKKPFFRRRQT